MHASINQMATLISGNLLDVDVEYICHQCNSRSRNAAGLAKSMFERYPYANIYKRREDNKTFDDKLLGSIIISGDGKETRYIANFIAQRYPGKPRLADTTECREEWFDRCLQSLESLKPKSCAFPFMIGCGLARGNWANYKSMIDSFATRTKIPVYIVKLD